MNHRQRHLAVLQYHPYDRLPIVHFGFWAETLQQWAAEGHLTAEEAREWADGNSTDAVISAKLGFDYNYASEHWINTGLSIPFAEEVVREFPDGSRHVRNAIGVTELRRPGAGSIPSEIDHLLKGRAEWEEWYRPRLQPAPERISNSWVRINDRFTTFADGGPEFLRADTRDYPYGIYCGSLYGQIRDYLGLENLCYLQADDEELLIEIIDTIGELSYQTMKSVLETGAKYDFGHFWEDICYKNGPLVNPGFFDRHVGPHYRRITELLRGYGITLVSLDCDGMIDALLPTWIQNGVNTMFPIEVGTWNASIAPWRRQYGRELRGVGGMNKVAFSRDRAAIDAEIERLKPLVDLGGYIPCPDHRIAPDAKWDLVQYYCARMRETF